MLPQHRGVKLLFGLLFVLLFSAGPSKLFADGEEPKTPVEEKPPVDSDESKIPLPKPQDPKHIPFGGHFESLENVEHEIRSAGFIEARPGGVVAAMNGVDARIGEFDIKCENLVLSFRELQDKDGKKIKRYRVYAEDKVFITYKNGDIQEYVSADMVEMDFLSREHPDFDANALTGTFKNALIRIYQPEPDLYIYLRGAEIKRYGLDRFEGDDVSATTSTYGADWWSVRASHLKYDRAESSSKRVQLTGARVQLGALPLIYLPRWNKKAEDTILRSVRVGSSGEFGPYIQTDWGGTVMDFIDMTLELDYYAKRGAAFGMDFNYYKPGKFFGYIDSYWLPKDHGEDFDDVPLLESNRGRVRMQHRHYLPGDWILDFEVSSISDRDFMEEYFEKEIREDKDQETYAYLRRVWDNKALTLLGKTRINDFVTETEYLPAAAFKMYGQRIGETGLYFDTESELASLRRRWNEDREGFGIFTTRSSRFDTRNTISLPLNLDNKLFFTPFATGMVSAYDDSVDGDDLTRAAGSAGARLSTQFWKTYDYQSKLLNADGIRHIVTPEIRYESVWGTSHDPKEIWQFDDLDDLVEGDFLKFSLRNRFETKRQLDEKDKEKTIVSLLDLDLELTYRLDRDHIEREHEFADLQYNLRFRPREKITMFSDAEYNIRHGVVDVFNGGLTYKQSRRLHWTLGQRYARDDYSVTSAVMEYMLSEKWATRTWIDYDFESKGILNEGLVFTRNFNDWRMQFGVEVDNGDDDINIVFGFSSPASPTSRDEFSPFYGAQDRSRLKK